MIGLVRTLRMKSQQILGFFLAASAVSFHLCAWRNWVTDGADIWVYIALFNFGSLVIGIPVLLWLLIRKPGS